MCIRDRVEAAGDQALVEIVVAVVLVDIVRPDHARGAELRLRQAWRAVIEAEAGAVLDLSLIHI